MDTLEPWYRQCLTIERIFIMQIAGYCLLPSGGHRGWYSRTSGRSHFHRKTGTVFLSVLCSRRVCKFCLLRYTLLARLRWEPNVVQKRRKFWAYLHRLSITFRTAEWHSFRTWTASLVQHTINITNLTTVELFLYKGRTTTLLKIGEESRQRPLLVFAPILWSALKLDTIVPREWTSYVDRL